MSGGHGHEGGHHEPVTTGDHINAFRDSAIELGQSAIKLISTGVNAAIKLLFLPIALFVSSAHAAPAHGHDAHAAAHADAHGHGDADAEAKHDEHGEHGDANHAKDDHAKKDDHGAHGDSHGGHH